MTTQVATKIDTILVISRSEWNATGDTRLNPKRHFKRCAGKVFQEGSYKSPKGDCEHGICFCCGRDVVIIEEGFTEAFDEKGNLHSLPNGDNLP